MALVAFAIASSVYASRALRGIGWLRLVPIVPKAKAGHAPATYSTWARCLASSTIDHTQPARSVVRSAWALVNETDMTKAILRLHGAFVKVAPLA